ncbi:hypothetical protein K8I85_07530, partial [bacterium]|nr:hypothetical protein [bacterium]
MHRAPPVSIATALAIAFTVLSAWILRGPADASHSFPDGAVYRYQAQTLAAGHLFAAAPPDPLAFRFPMTRTADDKWLSPYYPGFALFLAPAIPLRLEWLVNPLLGGLLIFGTFLLGRRLYGSDTGLLAAAMLALSPFHLSIASTFLSHVACAVLLLAAAL